MDEGSYGLIELLLVFGLLLGWAVWDIVRTRRELSRMRGKVEK
ncbi:hypothetical protein [uncultured Enterovirga sp.]